MKLERYGMPPAIGKSPPVRGRGLKLNCPEEKKFKLNVAPRAGAWIETSLDLYRLEG